jgi:hypothetical protein
MGDARGRLEPSRQAIARGEAIFNHRAFRPQGVSCSTCHDAPNTGSNSSGAFVSLALSDAGLRTPDWVGGGVLRYVAGAMIVEDGAVRRLTGHDEP